ncbi:hypothetical protein HDU96_006394 [Phlyctochytrium bullatum]|nr:hypothetical protein HDU96_006394 [Phlyctochytrium bullatum]
MPARVGRTHRCAVNGQRPRIRHAFSIACSAPLRSLPEFASSGRTLTTLTSSCSRRPHPNHSLHPPCITHVSPSIGSTSQTTFRNPSDWKEAVDADWLAVALDHPLVHQQTNTAIHLVGVQPGSGESLARLAVVAEALLKQYRNTNAPEDGTAPPLSSFSARGPFLWAVQCGRERLDLGTWGSNGLASEAWTELLGSPATGFEGLSLLRERSEPRFDIWGRKMPPPGDVDLVCAIARKLADREFSSHAISADDAAFRLPFLHAVDVESHQLLDPDSFALQKHLDALRLHYRVPPLPRVLTSGVGRGLHRLLHRLQLGSYPLRAGPSNGKGSGVSSVAEFKFARRIYAQFYPKEFNALFLTREALMVDNFKRMIKKLWSQASPAKPDGGAVRKPSPPARKVILAVVGKIHIEGLYNTWATYAGSKYILGSKTSTVSEVYEAPNLSRLETRLDQTYVLPTPPPSGESWDMEAPQEDAVLPPGPVGETIVVVSKAVASQSYDPLSGRAAPVSLQDDTGALDPDARLKALRATVPAYAKAIGEDGALEYMMYGAAAEIVSATNVEELSAESDRPVDTSAETAAADKQPEPASTAPVYVAASSRQQVPPVSAEMERESKPSPQRSSFLDPARWLAGFSKGGAKPMTGESPPVKKVRRAPPPPPRDSQGRQRVGKGIKYVE